jgi:NAD-dependent deacetylase
MSGSNLESPFPAALVDDLRAAKRVAVLTGSGISAESGIPTFREAQTGLWSKYDPEMLATPEAFARDPKLVWDWYSWRRQLISQASPNEGHRALVEMENLFEGFQLITQNVDGLHAMAGSSDVIELHGNIMRSKCNLDGTVVTVPGRSGEGIPVCPRCGSNLRPDVVWFGESLPAVALNRALIASQTCDIFFSIGTASVVQPAASLVFEARRHGAVTVEINIEETVATPYFTYALRGSAAMILPQLITALSL